MKRESDCLVTLDSQQVDQSRETQKTKGPGGHGMGADTQTPRGKAVRELRKHMDLVCSALAHSVGQAQREGV